MGELFAFFTACLWASSSIFFSMASNRVGALNTNRIRLLFAVVYLGIAHLVLRGSLVPVDASLERWAWLGISGVFGLVIGDLCLMQTYVLVGTRLGTLMMAMSPVMSAILAWALLGEHLTLQQVTGILVTSGGIMLVVLERRNGAHVHDRRRYLLGILFGLGGALGQAAGLVLSKIGLAGGYPALSGVVIRMISAGLVMWLITLFSGQARATVQTGLQNPGVLKFIALGATFGPFLGVWMSLLAVQSSYVGIASTLMALTPVLVLPVLKWVFHEQITLRAALGTAVAMAGVALIFLT